MTTSVRQCGVVWLAVASCWTPQLSAQEEVSSECIERCEYLSDLALDASIKVIPALESANASLQSFASPALQAAAVGWARAAQWRLDDPNPVPPTVPVGAAGLAWAMDNPPDFWRVIMPIPPDQAPRLTLPAKPRTQRLRSILTGTASNGSAPSKATVIVTSQGD